MRHSLYRILVYICFTTVCSPPALTATAGISNEIINSKTAIADIINLFPDTNLVSCIEKLAAKNHWQYAEEIRGKISCAKQAIKNLNGIEFFTNVTSIDLSTNYITDLTPLAKLLQLRTLKLEFNSICKLEPIAGLTNLRILAISNNSIENITSITNLTQLTHLNLQNNLINNIEPVRTLTNLQYLDLGLNKIIDIDAISSLRKLEYLSLLNNEVVNISAVAYLSNIQGLNLRGNEISQVGSLMSLSKLSNVNLANNPIAGYYSGQIETLATLANIIRVDLSDSRTISCAGLVSLASGLNLHSQVVYPGIVENGVTCTHP